MELMDIFLVSIWNFDDVSKSIGHVVEYFYRIHKFLVSSNHSCKECLEMNNKLLLIVVLVVVRFEFEYLFNKSWNVEVSL